MASILVPLSGASADEAVLATALAAAHPLKAHLDCVHIRISAGEAAAWTPHLGFARGKALREALDWLASEGLKRDVAARLFYGAFCQRHGLAVRREPAQGRGLSAEWREEAAAAPTERLLTLARCHDLVVLGRATGANGLPSDFLEQIVTGCGRPVLIAARCPPRTVAGTVMVCWKDTDQAAHAVSAAMPLLACAARVVLVGVEEAGAGSEESLGELARQLAWHGIALTTAFLPGGAPVCDRLLAAAAKFEANLLVAGAYSRNRMRELVFGGVTQWLIDNAELPVLLVH